MNSLHLLWIIPAVIATESAMLLCYLYGGKRKKDSKKKDKDQKGGVS